MDKNKLISYSFYYLGEYDKIIKAINENADVPIVNVPNTITIFDNTYPKQLLNLKCPPMVLYYKGNLELLKQDAIAIVGSRMPCEYALKATKALVQANQDKVIVSGLAKGIERPIKTLEEVKQNINEYVNIKLDKKSIEGTIRKVNGDIIQLEYLDKNIKKMMDVNYKKIKKIRKAVKI